VHSLNILIKYARMYGFEHKRTDGQFETAWNELQQSFPPGGGEGGFLLGVSDNRLLMDGIPLESGQAEKSFAQLLSAAGLASLHFSKDVTTDDFARLVKAFTTSGSKAQDVSKQIKEALGTNKGSIRINEVKFIAADPLTGDISIAAQLAAQTLGPEFKDWLNDPQKLMQLIAAAEGANAGGGGSGDGSGSGEGSGTGGGMPLGSVPNMPKGQAVRLGEPGDGPGVEMVPLQEAEVIQAIRLLTRFGEAQNNPNISTADLQKDLSETDVNTRVNLQQLLAGLASQATSAQEQDAPLLMKAAEHMAIRFALERYSKGEVKVNAVHQMMEHMSRQMDSLRHILRLQEEKMSKAGMLVESHADVLDRMFWAEVPESGKMSVLMSHDAACVPPRNVRQFAELLMDREDKITSGQILTNYCNGLDAKDVEPRKKTCTGLSQLADLYARQGGEIFGNCIQKLSHAIAHEPDPELQSMMAAAFVRLSQEANSARNYTAINEVCAGLDTIGRERPVLVSELRPRVGVENRIPEFIEEALQQPLFDPAMLAVLRRTSFFGAEHLADRFFRCARRDECDRMVELVQEIGPPALIQLREVLRTAQPRQAAATVGVLSRLDVATLLELLPTRLPEWNRFYHDIVVRQIAYGASPDRGRTLLELAEIIDPLVLPEAVDEMGMSGNPDLAAALAAMAKPGETESRSPFVHLKAIESLGRLRAAEAVPVLREIVETKKTFGWVHHKELRVAAAQALAKIDPRYSAQVVSDSGLEPAELAIAPLDMAPACPFVRQRRYERMFLAKSVHGIISSSWGKSKILIRELSLGGGMGTKEDNLRIGSEAQLEISVGVRHKIKAHVLLRRARVNEVGFEIVSTDLESRYRLRRLLVEALERAPQAKNKEWSGDRK
jgi:hypothetical protein